MNILNLEHVTKRYVSKPVLTDVTIGIEDTDLYDYVFDHYDLNETCSEEEISEEDIEEVSETQDTEEVLRAEKDQLEE